MNQSAASVQPSSIVVFRDGLGERRRVTDSTGRESVDLCASTARWCRAGVRGRRCASVPVASPTSAIRRSATCAASTVSAAATLAVISDAAPGSRLADLLAAAVEHHLTLDINAALCVIRQFVPAIDALHEHDRDIIHGALGPSASSSRRARVWSSSITRWARPLEQLRYSHQRYWKDLRVALPRSAGLPNFDHRVDVTQIGVVALSLDPRSRARTTTNTRRNWPELVGSAWAIGSAAISSRCSRASAPGCRARCRSICATRSRPWPKPARSSSACSPPTATTPPNRQPRTLSRALSSRDDAAGACAPASAPSSSIVRPE